MELTDAQKVQLQRVEDYLMDNGIITSNQGQLYIVPGQEERYVRIINSHDYHRRALEGEQFRYQIIEQCEQTIREKLEDTAEDRLGISKLDTVLFALTGHKQIHDLVEKYLYTSHNSYVLFDAINMPQRVKTPIAYEDYSKILQIPLMISGCVQDIVSTIVMSGRDVLLKIRDPYTDDIVGNHCFRKISDRILKSADRFLGSKNIDTMMSVEAAIRRLTANKNETPYSRGLKAASELYRLHTFKGRTTKTLLCWGRREKNIFGKVKEKDNILKMDHESRQYMLAALYAGTTIDPENRHKGITYIPPERQDVEAILSKVQEKIEKIQSIDNTRTDVEQMSEQILENAFMQKHTEMVEKVDAYRKMLCIDPLSVSHTYFGNMKDDRGSKEFINFKVSYFELSDVLFHPDNISKAANEKSEIIINLQDNVFMRIPAIGKEYSVFKINEDKDFSNHQTLVNRMEEKRIPIPGDQSTIVPGEVIDVLTEGLKAKYQIQFHDRNLCERTNLEAFIVAEFGGYKISKSDNFYHMYNGTDSYSFRQDNLGKLADIESDCVRNILAHYKNSMVDLDMLKDICSIASRPECNDIFSKTDVDAIKTLLDTPETNNVYVGESELLRGISRIKDNADIVQKNLPDLKSLANKGIEKILGVLSQECSGKTMSLEEYCETSKTLNEIRDRINKYPGKTIER